MTEKATLSQSPERFFNRELSWLNFNGRVLEEAANKDHPILERLRFLSISANNLDEFYMVRYAGLREQKRAGIKTTSQDGLSPEEQIEKIEALAEKIMREQQVCLKAIRQSLSDEGVKLVKPEKLRKSDLVWLEKTFDESILPILTPWAVDPAQPFPFLPNRGFALALALKSENDKETETALISLPSFAKRFIRLPDKSPGAIRYIALERVIPLFLDRLYPGFKEVGRCLFRILRDSDIEIDDEAEDLIREFEILLKQRRRGRIIRIQINDDAPQDLREFILREIEAEPNDVVSIDGMIGLAQLSELITSERRDLQFPVYEPRYPERIREHGGDCFAAIRKKDILVHHPYESFDVVAEFLRQAAEDPDVVAIKQTLYRTVVNSPIVNALIEAAEAGKAVTALVEIKARFDEETNLRLARDLERAGVQVVYGFIDYKTHAKVSLVIRREDGELRSYTHFGTGNYHPITARIYTDLSLFTADPALGRDAGRLFNYVTAYREPPDRDPGLEKLIMSPVTLAPSLLEMIENEERNAKAGKPCGIWAKMNSLVDGEQIDALYSASQAGVPIRLVVRGICCLRPGIKGLSETIEVRSIIGRFLEHSRIMVFANGDSLPSTNAKVFMTSADLMPRNLKRRVEVMVPVENPTVHRQIIGQIMVSNLNDNEQTWLLDGRGTYHRVKGGADETAFAAHQYFMEHPSLSGRGSALELSEPPKLKPGKLRVK
ncbi:MAG: RNA degradosome polyphosphate kinase [Pseudomonadota bacterium]